MSITISGNVCRADAPTAFILGTPRKNQPISFICWTAIIPVSVVCSCGTFSQSTTTPILVTTTTDCFGNYSVTLPNGISNINAYIGAYIANSTWLGFCDTHCTGNPQFIPDPSVNPKTNQLTGATNDATGSTASTWTGSGGGHGPVNYTGPIIAPGVIPPGSAFVLNFFSGDIANQHQGEIYVLVKKGTQYYQVNNANITLNDSCSASNTITGYATTVNGGALFTDWPLWTSMVINAGLPPNCSYSTNTNLTPVSLPAHTYLTNGTTLPVPVETYDLNFLWAIVIQDCTPVATTVLIADHYLNIISLSWINSLGEVWASNHRHPSKQIGTSTVGWDTPVKLAGTSLQLFTNLGMTYLEDGTLELLCYTSSVVGAFTNLDFGDTTAWTGSVVSGFGVETLIPGPRTRAQTAALAMAVSHAGLVVDTTKSGTFTISTPDFSPLPDLKRGGMIDTGSKYGVLTTIAGVTYFGTCNYIGGSMTINSVSTISGHVASMVQCKSHTLVALIYDTASSTCKAARSRDGGLTWEQDTTAISAIPALATPPMLVSLDGGLYAVWLISQQPWFAFSPDEGKTWT